MSEQQTHRMHAAEHLDDDIAVESTDNPLSASDGSGYRQLDRAALEETTPQGELPRQHSTPDHAPPPFAGGASTPSRPRATSERSAVTMAAVEESDTL